MPRARIAVGAGDAPVVERRPPRLGQGDQLGAAEAEVAAHAVNG